MCANLAHPREPAQREIWGDRFDGWAPQGARLSRKEAER